MKGIIGPSKDLGDKHLEAAHELSELSAQREVDSEGNSFGNAPRRKRRKETPSRGALLTPAIGALFRLGITPLLGRPGCSERPRSIRHRWRRSSERRCGPGSRVT